MLVACIDVLRDFWRSNGDEDDIFVPRVIENQGRRLRIRTHVEEHPDFERSDGQTVEKSWLRLQALPRDDDHIGLGVMKCRAVCELEEELKRWLRRGATHYPPLDRPREQEALLHGNRRERCSFPRCGAQK
jgi:hypothetical protein